jgi:hypothetical protein
MLKLDGLTPRCTCPLLPHIVLLRLIHLRVGSEAAQAEYEELMRSGE